MTDVGGIAGDRLRSFVERIERLEEEKAGISADIKDVYAQAKGDGFDVKTIREVVKRRKLDKSERDEQDALLELYERALGMLRDTPLGEAALSRAARKFVDSAAREDGASVSVTDSDGNGFSVRNEGGRKVVETVGNA